MKNENVCMITSGALCPTIIYVIHDIDQFQTIFIFDRSKITQLLLLFFIMLKNIHIKSLCAHSNNRFSQTKNFSSE